MADGTYHFGDGLSFETASSCLRVNGDEVHLEPQQYVVMQTLLEAAGDNPASERWVSKETLRDKLGTDSETRMYGLMSALRKATRDDAQQLFPRALRQSYSISGPVWFTLANPFAPSYEPLVFATVVEPLAHGEPFIRRCNLISRASGSEFFLAFPEDILKEVHQYQTELGLCTDALTVARVEDSIFEYDNGVQGLADAMGVDDLSDRLCRLQREVASRLRAKWAIAANALVAESPPDEIEGFHFNRPKAGIWSMDFSRSQSDETPIWIINTYETDYFTSQVTTELWRELRQHQLVKRFGAEQLVVAGYEPYRAFFSSIGLNMVLECGDGHVYLHRRSANVAEGAARGQAAPESGLVHISMNEGVNDMDRRPDGTYDLFATAKRGFEEEVLGPLVDEIRTMEIANVFVTKDLGQVGLSGYAFTERPFVDAEKIETQAKREETAQTFPVEVDQIESYMAAYQNQFQPHGLYVLASIAQIAFRKGFSR